MNREQWADIEARLVYPGARVKLQCDTDVVDLIVHREKMRMSIFVFINGELDPKVGREDCDHRRRFWRPVVRKPRPFKASEIRAFGKRWCADEIKRNTFTWYSPEWPSLTQLRRHFEKNNTSVVMAVAEPEAAGTQDV